MKIEKLPSGSYRIRKVINEKRMSFTFDHKPTKAEIEKEIANAMLNVKKENECMTFDKAAEKYISSKNNVLSPSTIRDYEKLKRNMPEWFSDYDIFKMDQNTINLLVNELSENKSPKTVRNYHGFVHVVLATFRHELIISTHLPQKKKTEPYIPSDDDVKKLLAEAEGTKYKIPIKLACYGLRRSEIIAFSYQDIKDNKLIINKAKVLNSDNEWIEKTTKTTESTRNVPIAESFADELTAAKWKFDMHPNDLTDFMTDSEKKLGLEHFSLHKLRHYYASKLLANGIDIKTVQYLGGWETQEILLQIYAHMMKDKEKELIASSIIADAVF